MERIETCSQNTGQVIGEKGQIDIAVDQAMQFYMFPNTEKERQIYRTMTQSATSFNHTVTAYQYIDLYEKILE
jgi:hypothetical protein